MDTRWILDDAERALLAALHAQGVGPMETASTASAATRAETTHGFDSGRLAQAFETLGEKDLVEPLGDGRVRLTRNGFLHAHDAAESLGAGITSGI